MSSVVLSGDTSGTITVSAPAVSGSSVQTLAAVTGTLAPVVSGTAQATTSGTSFDFTGIPSWAKKITVMFNGVSTSGTSVYLVQIGAGSVQTSGYVAGVAATTSTAGFPVTNNFTAATTQSGLVSINNITNNTWVSAGIVGASGGNAASPAFGTVSLSGALDRVRITTVNGTDTFDAGSINILYE
jgi:phage-related tail fiber protein